MSFEDVALAFLEECETTRAGTLFRYIDQYPQYACDLLLLVVVNELADDEPGPPVEPSPALMERLRADAASVFARGTEQ